MSGIDNALGEQIQPSNKLIGIDTTIIRHYILSETQRFCATFILTKDIKK